MAQDPKRTAHILSSIYNADSLSCPPRIPSPRRPSPRHPPLIAQCATLSYTIHNATMSTPPSRNSAHADTDATGHLQVPGQHADVIHRLKNVPGYTTPVFKGKEEQRAKVQANVAAKVSHHHSQTAPPLGSCAALSRPLDRMSRR